MKARRVLGSLVLALALFLGITASAAPKAQASTQTKKVTLITGESYKVTIWMGGSVRSVSSSKKSVIAAKKDGSAAVVCKAKKAGKATVTIRTTRGNVAKYIFTVKKFKIEAQSVSVHYTTGSVNTTSDIALRVTNKTGVYISQAKVMVNLFDETGSLLEKKEYTFYDLLPGVPIYKMITYYGNPVMNMSCDQKVAFSRISTDKVYNMSKKVKVVADSSGQSMEVKIANKSKKSVSGSADIVFFNENGEIVYVRPCSFYLKAKEATTTSVSLLSGLETATYKIFTRAFAR